MTFPKCCLWAGSAGLVLVCVGLALGQPRLWMPAAAVVAVALAIGLGAVPTLATYRYTAWIIAAVVVAMLYPGAFQRWGGLDLRHKWLVLAVVQAVMFGMGTQMSLRDFAGVLKMPWGVVVAVGCQFLIMPLTGWALTRVFAMPPEIAAGVILIGACSSGLASNVMCYLAGANLALSVTATAVATMLAPVMTPLWMKLLAGELVEVSFAKMMTEIVKIVVVPIGAALLHDFLKRASRPAQVRVARAQVLGGVLAVFLFLTRAQSWRTGLADGAQLAVELLGFLGGAVAFGASYHALTRLSPRVEQLMPRLSMIGIVYFTLVTTAAGRDALLAVGATLVLVAILHNGAGYLLGYGLSRVAGLDVQSARTVAIEVGLQNGGMASGLAGAMGKLATVGLASAVFSPWMNISGSLLANVWRRRPPSGSGS
ncbi:bile acid:sodium symporter family protein [Actomonas aquatica]|uniref:Bile acid:sodium symporter family protein n=1 Tax=Actomonas aquatica TaxID=2866162 RepID=A0ABZ1CCA6_9BACT|nr:bile acid:sodium symporter family protein [Opitutus sp. WL0086]WRQ88224.1 bile acid:sodium symporter family protein [Opitutus sp. WL0086]